MSCKSFEKGGVPGKLDAMITFEFICARESLFLIKFRFIDI